MYDANNILRRYPRYDTDFNLGDPSLNWNEPTESSSWVYTLVVVLWVVGTVALILFACTQSRVCPWYDWLCKLRRQQYRPHPGAEYSEDWGSPHVVVGQEPHQALIPSSSHPQQKRFDDLPPAYSEVVKADLPPYPPQSDVAQISATIPDRDWTSRTRTDNRDNEI